MDIVILFILLLLSAFFSGIELAYFSMSELKVRQMIKHKKPNAKLVRKLKKDPQKLLVTILIGNNLVNIGAASFATVVALHTFGDAGISIATGVMTVLILIFGEITPKAFCTKHADYITRLFARPMYILSALLTPISVPLSMLVKKLTGKGTHGPIVSEEEIKLMTEVGHEEGVVEEDERTMITNIFHLNDITAKDAMTPLHEAFTFSEDDWLHDIREELWDTGYSRIPLIDKSTNNVTGLLYRTDALKAFYDEKEDIQLDDLARKANFVKEGVRLDQLLKYMQQQHIHLAIVRSPKQESLGIITLEDILEHIVGDIADEEDLDEHFIHKIEDNEILVLGKTQLNDVNNYFNTNLTGSHTIEGFLDQELDKPPKEGEVYEFEDLVFTIKKVEKEEVKIVRIVQKEEEEE